MYSSEYVNGLLEEIEGLKLQLNLQIKKKKELKDQLNRSAEHHTIFKREINKLKEENNKLKEKYNRVKSNVNKTYKINALE